jgi:hypothetical protein
VAALFAGSPDEACQLVACSELFRRDRPPVEKEQQDAEWFRNSSLWRRSQPTNSATYVFKHLV